MTTEQHQQPSPSDSLCSCCKGRHTYYKTGHKSLCTKDRALKVLLASGDKLNEYLKQLLKKYWKDPEMKRLIHGAMI